MMNGCPVATGRVGGQGGILRRVFIQSDESSFTPKVEYVELFGEDPSSAGSLYEKFVPGR